MDMSAVPDVGYAVPCTLTLHVSKGTYLWTLTVVSAEECKYTSMTRSSRSIIYLRTRKLSAYSLGLPVACLGIL